MNDTVQYRKEEYNTIQNQMTSACSSGSVLSNLISMPSGIPSMGSWYLVFIVIRTLKYQPAPRFMTTRRLVDASGPSTPNVSSTGDQ